MAKLLGLRSGITNNVDRPFASFDPKTPEQHATEQGFVKAA